MGSSLFKILNYKRLEMRNSKFNFSEFQTFEYTVLSSKKPRNIAPKKSNRCAKTFVKQQTVAKTSNLCISLFKILEYVPPKILSISCKKEDFHTHL